MIDRFAFAGVVKVVHRILYNSRLSCKGPSNYFFWTFCGILRCKMSTFAIAALTLVGAASAQVTLTGTLSFSQQSSLDRTRGIAASDNSIFLGDTEDLGGGVKLVMSTGFDAGGRGATGGGNFGGENTSLAVSGGFGKVTLTQFESDGPFANIDALSGASLPVGVFDSAAITGGKRFRNGLLYSSPSFGGATLGLSYVTLAGTFAPENALDAKTKVTPNITYVAGPLKAYFEYSLFNASYNNNADDTVTQPTAYVTYDFGVAKVGFGYSKPSNADGQLAFGVNAPIGALTVGYAYFSANGNGNGVSGLPGKTNTFGTATYSEASVAYDLSKRTSIKASFGVVNDAFNSLAVANATYGLAGGFTTTTQSRVGLFHSF